MDKDANDVQKQALEIPANKGKTLDELRFQRAITLVKLEMQKDLLRQKFQPIYANHTVGGVWNLLSKSNDGKTSKIGYLMLGFKASKMAFRLWNAWNNRKNR